MLSMSLDKVIKLEKLRDMVCHLEDLQLLP
jgi:hypothetical protein